VKLLAVAHGKLSLPGRSVRATPMRRHARRAAFRVPLRAKNLRAREVRRMDCWTCEKTALGSCRFCGRGACREHAQLRPFIVSLFRARTDQVVNAVVVEDALHCGVCSPRGEPVPLPDLD
jgi:hypothetical protein